MHLSLSTLGTLHATTTDAQGAVRSLGRGKPVAMLAYLACVPGHKASREYLAALLWGEVESEAARQNLRQTIWYLKKKLGDGLLDSSAELLGLSASVSSDRDDFLQAAQKADFVAAVQRYLGPFIPDFAAPGASEFEQWCELERRRLTVTFLRCADALARQWLGEGKFRDAQELARRARNVDAMDQSTWRLLLETLIAGSDSLGAASEAEHFETFLAREEQEPEAASITALRAARWSPAASTPGETGPSSSIAAELVGRESEFSRVLSAWERSRGNTPQVLVVTAAAGLGKSRLLRDVQARLRASRSRSLLVRANPGDRHLSGGFAAEVASQLAALPGATAVSTGSAGVLVSLAPALASIYVSATPDPSEGEEAVRRRAFAVVDLAHAVSDEHPVALLLDDLHWADELSARVLAAAFSRLEHAKLLVVMTKRPVADPRGLFTPFEQLELPPLDLAAVTSFVAHVAELPSKPWADLLPQQLLLATGGSPLLLVETLHGALEQGWLSCSDSGVWQCEDAARITASLREGSAVHQRVLRLVPDARRVLLVLAAIGRPVDLSETLAIVGGDPRGVEEQVEFLERGGFLTRNGAQMSVAHDEIADAAMQAATEDERRSVHATVARELLARKADEHTLRRAAEHATIAAHDALVVHAWQRFLRLRRAAGDRRTTRRVAADFLGLDSEQRSVRKLVAATPLRSRRRARWMAAGVFFAAAFAAAAAWPRAPRALTSDFAFWTVDSTSGRGRLVGVRIPRDAAWEAGSPIEAVDLDSMAFPIPPRGSKQALRRSPNGKEWWGHVVVDSLGDESVFIDSLGGRHLPLASPYDDDIESLSPDGRLFAGATARYDTTTDHLSIVIGDRRGGRVTRLTAAAEYDRLPIWRPDGTQIAFQRHYYTVRSPDRICLVDVDGRHERCLDTALREGETIAGWLDERHILITSRTLDLIVLDAVSGERSSIEHFKGQVWSTGGSIRTCDCSVAQGAAPSVYLFPATDPTAARPVRYRGKPLRGAVRIIAPLFASDRWLESLSLRVPARGVAIGHMHHLQVEGFRKDGAPAWLHDLRWTSRNALVATVDSAGRLTPRRVGDTWVIVSAGGWRTDSALVRVLPTTERRLLSERWDRGWEARWRPFGMPLATVIGTDRGPALLPNGDGSYGSGAYIPAPVSAADGLGVEAFVNLRVTGTQWQTLSLDFVDATMLQALRSWDHRTGDGVTSGSSICSLAFPGAEGASFRDNYSLSGTRGARILPSTPTLFNGSWHRVRLQYFPDGWCALALDGEPLGVIPSAPPLSGGVILVIAGHDRLGGRLVVGHLEAWSGVRGGVDWTRLDGNAATTQP
ncbi:MAG: AAA family ATPase [Gemmatimonadaceae bacterium]|jgi:DNA-binding SARP family transcriptional activator